MTERASLDELLEFANKVREAGGGNPLSALMPAVPEEATQCLIAVNLNFNCSINGADEGLPEGPWYMFLDDPAIAERISDALDLPRYDLEGSRVALRLPDRIGEVAADFDQAQVVAQNARDGFSLDADEEALLREMGPYISEATIETYDLARIIHPDGSVTI